MSFARIDLRSVFTKLNWYYIRYPNVQMTVTNIHAALTVHSTFILVSASKYRKRTGKKNKYKYILLGTLGAENDAQKCLQILPLCVIAFELEFHIHTYSSAVCELRGETSQKGMCTKRCVN